MLLKNRFGSLLDLQEQRIVMIATLEQEYEATSTCASHAHDLDREVDQPIFGKQVTDVVGNDLLVLLKRFQRYGANAFAACLATNVY